MMSGHLGEILWRPLVYIYQPDKYQEIDDVTFRAISGKYYAMLCGWVVVVVAAKLNNCYPSIS